jgi:Holliday junction resolvase
LIRARVDSNQKEIVAALRKCGYSVYCTHTVGKGFPDLVIGAKNRNFLFEVKDGKKTKSQKKLTEKENDFFQSWNGQVSIIESVEDALHIINNS